MSKANECFYCGMPLVGYNHDDCGRDWDYKKDEPYSGEELDDEAAA